MKGPERVLICSCWQHSLHHPHTWHVFGWGVFPIPLPQEITTPLFEGIALQVFKKVRRLWLREAYLFWFYALGLITWVWVNLTPLGRFVYTPGLGAPRWETCTSHQQTSRRVEIISTSAHIFTSLCRYALSPCEGAPCTNFPYRKQLETYIAVSSIVAGTRFAH